MLLSCCLVPGQLSVGADGSYQLDAPLPPPIHRVCDLTLSRNVLVFITGLLLWTVLTATPAVGQKQEHGFFSQKSLQRSGEG